MAGYPGSVGLTGYIAPADTLDTYALQSEVFNRGGFRTVADTTERDAIASDRRKLGMWVQDLSTGLIWTLKTGLTDSDWEEAVLPPPSSSFLYSDSGDEVWLNNHNFLIAEQWDTSSNLSIYIQDIASEWVDGRIAFISVTNDAIGASDAILYTVGSDYIRLVGTTGTTQTLAIPRGSTLMLQFMNNANGKLLWVTFVGGSGSTVTEVVETISTNASKTNAGTYFIDKDSVILELTSNATNRKFKVKSQGVSCSLQTDNGIIDGVTQDVQLSPNSSVEVFAKDDDTYWILNKY